MRDNSNLRRLLHEVPFLHIDEKAARIRGDHEALRYARAVEHWRLEAAQALVEDAEPVVEHCDAFVRIAAVSELMQSSATVPA